MMQAHQQLAQALEAGATLTAENTRDGAILRVEAPKGAEDAVIDAQEAVQALAELATSGEGMQGCSCPMMRPGQGQGQGQDQSQGQEQMRPGRQGGQAP